MRRFNYEDNNEEYRKEVDNFFRDIGNESDITQEEYEAIMREEQEYVDLQHQIIRQELNHRLLRTAIRMVENSFWSRFYSFGTRLQMIDKAYRKLKKLEEQSDA